MIHAYVINLETHFERKIAFEQNVKDKNIDKFINFNFIKAVDGRKLVEEDKKKFSVCSTWFDPLLQTGITCGEIGCALSHYNAWKKFYDSGEEFALFFEDDVFFLDNFEKNFKHFLEYPKDADIVYLRRKRLFKNKETIYDEYFYKIKASYGLYAYLLTKKGVEKIINETKYLNNLIVVDEFLPILYDNDYLNYYKKYYNTTLNAYSIKEEYYFIQLIDNNFESSTFHSNYFKFNSQFIAISSEFNVSMSSIERFKKSCDKYSIQYKFIDFIDIVNVLNNEIDNDKYIILLNCNYSFFINNPIKLIIQENKDFYYSNFNNSYELIANYNNNSLCFFGKKEILLSLIDNKFDKSKMIEENNICELLEQNNMTINKSNKIIVLGAANPLLLNKYENHKLNKCSKCYGYKNIHKSDSNNFKIRINILMYDNTLLHCYNAIKKIDYPKDLLDINVYSLSNIFIHDDSVKIYKTTEMDAYLSVYSYYKDYDYIWIVNSTNIITEPSLLNDLIHSNKLISSGLIKKENAYLTNFWAGITEKSWYLRSDDYLDIIHTLIIGLWNVPYITGNILLSKQVLEMYDIFKDKSLNDIDRILCHNLRLLNEGMYLLNSKVYGYIFDVPPPTETENIITKNDVKTNNDTATKENIDIDLNKWTENEIFSPEYLKFYNLNDMSVLNEVQKGSDIWCFPFFTPEFCDFLVKIAETNGNWSGGIYSKGTIDKRIGAVENIPTQDIHLKDLGLEPFWLEIINKHFKKIMSKLYHYSTKNYNIAFIVKYDAEKGQASLQPHHDASVYTTNIALCSDSDYEGGGVKFHSKNITFFNRNKGWLCLHPGRVTHYHEALPITKGVRYILVSFNN